MQAGRHFELERFVKGIQASGLHIGDPEAFRRGEWVFNNPPKVVGFDDSRGSEILADDEPPFVVYVIAVDPNETRPANVVQATRHAARVRIPRPGAERALRLVYFGGSRGYSGRTEGHHKRLRTAVTPRFSGACGGGSGGPPMTPMELTQELGGAPVLIAVAAFDTPSEWATAEETLIMLNNYMAECHGRWRCLNVSDRGEVPFRCPSSGTLPYLPFGTAPCYFSYYWPHHWRDGPRFVYCYYASHDGVGGARRRRSRVTPSSRYTRVFSHRRLLFIWCCGAFHDPANDAQDGVPFCQECVHPHTNRDRTFF